MKDPIAIVGAILVEAGNTLSDEVGSGDSERVWENAAPQDGTWVNREAALIIHMEPTITQRQQSYFDCVAVIKAYGGIVAGADTASFTRAREIGRLVEDRLHRQSFNIDGNRVPLVSLINFIDPVKEADTGFPVQISRYRFHIAP